MPPGFGIVGSEQTDLHDENVPMNQSFCLKCPELCCAALRLCYEAPIFGHLFPAKKRSSSLWEDGRSTNQGSSLPKEKREWDRPNGHALRPTIKLDLTPLRSAKCGDSSIGCAWLICLKNHFDPRKQSSGDLLIDS